MGGTQPEKKCNDCRKWLKGGGMERIMIPILTCPKYYNIGTNTNCK